MFPSRWPGLTDALAIPEDRMNVCTQEYVKSLELWAKIYHCFPRHLTAEDKQAVFGQFIRRRLRAAGFRTPGDPS